jgi:hypothetical protein
MTETPEQYMARIGNLVKGQNLLEILETTPPKLAGLLTGKPTALISSPPAPGKWSPAEIVIHLAEVDLVMGYRMRLILGANGTSIQAFDQDAWALRYVGQPYEPALELFCALRSANLALLKSLTPGQWQQYGMHAERGKETIERVVLMNAGHDLNHLQQLVAILG